MVGTHWEIARAAVLGSKPGRRPDAGCSPGVGAAAAAVAPPPQVLCSLTRVGSRTAPFFLGMVGGDRNVATLSPQACLRLHQRALMTSNKFLHIEWCFGPHLHTPVACSRHMCHMIFRISS